MAPRPPSLAEIADRIASSLAVVSVDGRPVGGFIAGGGHLVTSYHAIAGASAVAVAVGGGSEVALSEAVAFDVRRDVAVLCLPERVGPGLAFAPDDEVAEGDAVFAQTTPGGAMTVVQVRAGATASVGDWLSFFFLPALSPDAASGTPVVNDAGAVVAVTTRIFAQGVPLAVGVPVKYLAPLLLRRDTTPLHALPVRRKGARREVPDHPPSLLAGSDPRGLEDAVDAIVRAIEVGAPAYNAGQVEQCYRVYERTARRIVSERADCPGLQRAMLSALARAASLDGDEDAQAWAMRDGFDGVLGAVERFEQSNAPSSKKSLLN